MFTCWLECLTIKVVPRYTQIAVINPLHFFDYFEFNFWLKETEIVCIYSPFYCEIVHLQEFQVVSLVAVLIIIIVLYVLLFNYVYVHCILYAY